MSARYWLLLPCVITPLICCGIVAAQPDIEAEVLRVGDEVSVRCFTADTTHVVIEGPVGTDGTMDLPAIGPIQMAERTPSAVRGEIAERYRDLYPRCTVTLSVLRAAIVPQPPGRPAEAAPEAPPAEEAPQEAVPLTAAEQFAQLPRFGMYVFAREGVPAAAEATPGIARPQPEEGDGEVAAVEAVPPSYVIGPGDELAVRVWTDAIEHVTATPVVDADGRIYVELVGEVMVAGERLSDVRADITRRYRVFFDRAQVSVGLARTRTIEVRVTGDVRRPGKHRLSGTATLFSALYASGGPTEVGSLRAIKLLRQGQEPIVVDLYLYLLHGDVSADVPLAPDDTIFVPPVGAEIGVAGQVRRPARYEIKDAATLRQALEMAAGVTGTGWARNAQLWRVGDDGERRLLNVDAVGDDGQMPLRDGDLLVITPVLETPRNVVELSGAVLRPGIYEVRDGMTVRDLLEAAQGLHETAHTEQASIWRLDEKLDYTLVNFDLGAALAGDPEHNVSLQPGDRLIVLSEEDVERPMTVLAKGAVRAPDTFAWTEGMRVSDLVKRAGGLAEGAYTRRANLLRLGEDERRHLIPIELDAVLAGEEEADLTLERGDILEVLLRDAVADVSEVWVRGLVQKPGHYPRVEGMRVSDAILAAGGLERKAGDEVEYTPGGARGKVDPVYLMLRREGEGFEVEPDPILRDNDLVAVLGVGDLIPEAPAVTIHGRVARPGTYALQDSIGHPDTVYELVQRADGLLPDANPQGIVLYRMRTEIVGEEQEDDLAQVIGMFNRELAAATLEGDEARAAGMASQLTEGLQAALFEGASTVVIPPRRLNKQAWARAVPINGERLIESRGREGDFPLAPGDVIIVPRMPTTVTVLGAVVKPGAVPWSEGMRPRDYVAQSGDLTADARADRTVVIRANGEVTPRAFETDIRPGDIILVPSDYIFREVTWSSSKRMLSPVRAGGCPCAGATC